MTVKRFGLVRPTGIAEQLLYSTVRLHTFSESGEEGVGTAFFFHYELNEKTHVPLLITNKHVIRGACTAKIGVHLAATDEDGLLRPTEDNFMIDYLDFEKKWHPHPKEDVDLCALPVAGMIQWLKSEHDKSIYYIPSSKSFIPSQEQLDELNAIEAICMVGYPHGLFDSVNNFPILRRGTTASHPSVDYDGKSKMVIDIACFPGSSGSPVFILHEGAVPKKTGEIMMGRLVYLLGVLSSGPVMNAAGEIVVEEVPTGRRIKSVTPVMMHLGFIEKSKEILALCDDFVAKHGLVTS